MRSRIVTLWTALLIHHLPLSEKWSAPIVSTWIRTYHKIDMYHWLRHRAIRSCGQELTFPRYRWRTICKPASGRPRQKRRQGVTGQLHHIRSIGQFSWRHGPILTVVRSSKGQSVSLSMAGRMALVPPSNYRSKNVLNLLWIKLQENYSGKKI